MSPGFGGADGGPDWIPGKVGLGALSFDGENDYVEVPHSASLNMTDEVTITAWIKPKGLTDKYRTVAVKGGGGVNNYGIWYERVSPDRLTVHFEWKVGESGYCIEKFSLPIDEWSFIAAIFNKGTAQVWKNAEMYEETGFPTSLETNDKSLITNWVPYNQKPYATIDEVRIYNRALTLDEIRLLYLATA